MLRPVNRRAVLGAALGGLTALGLPSIGWTLAGPLPGTIKLNSNENPYGPSASALKAAYDAAKKGAYYSFNLQSELRALIAKRQGVVQENVVLSTGSNEALCAATAAWGKKGHILAPKLTYSPHLNYARRNGLEVKTVPLTDAMSIDLEAMAGAVTDRTALVYICNPNNPTGLTIDGDELREFCRRVGKNTTILVDEAYNELTEKPAYTSMMDLVRSNENIVITKTFSKVFGLAGMRVGYSLGRSDLIAKLGAHIMSWPNAVGVAAALASYGDTEFLEFSKQKIALGRKLVTDTFKRHGIAPLHSNTNFVYADIGRDANVFADRMRERGVLIGRVYAPYNNWSRVSMGKIEDLEAFSRAFDEVY